MNKLLDEHKIFIVIFLFALGIRMWHITNPLLDIHSWRQTGSAIVARNYVKNINLFQPTQDLNVNYPMAYGLYEYIIGMLGRLIGFSDLSGRLFSVFMFMTGFVYFYKLVKKFFDKNISLWSCAFYSFLPTSIYYSRNFQPDPSMVAMTIVFLYYFSKWVDEEKWIYYLLSITFANFSFMFKIPSLFILIPAAGYLFMKENLKIFIDWRWYLLVFSSTAFPLFFHWYVPIATHGKILSALFSQDKWAGKSILLDWTGFWWERFYINLSEFQLTHTGYFLFLFGLFKPLTDRKQWMFYYWMVGVVAFFISAANGMGHEYYWLPFMPVACIFIGRFCSDFFATWRDRWLAGGLKRFVFAFVSLMVFYSFGFSLVRYNDRCRLFLNYRQISDVVKANTKPDDMILVMSSSELEIFYYAHRKGNHICSFESLLGYLDFYDFKPEDVDIKAFKSSLETKNKINDVVLTALETHSGQINIVTDKTASQALNEVLGNPHIYNYIKLRPGFYLDNIIDLYKLAESGKILNITQIKVLNRELLRTEYCEALHNSGFVDGNSVKNYKLLAITDLDSNNDSSKTIKFMKDRFQIISEGSYGAVFKLKNEEKQVLSKSNYKPII